MIAGAFVEFLDRGYVYKGLKPVNWCIHDRTALAEAEVEYENHTSPSIWVRFALTSDPAAIDPALAGAKRLRPDLDHHALDHPGQHGHRLSSEVRLRGGGSWRRRLHRRAGAAEGHRGEAAAGTRPQVIAEFPGAKLEGAIFRHPFLERDSLGILGDHVTLEQGTGAVHTAPGHGQEDFEIGVEVRSSGLLSGGSARGASITPKARRAVFPKRSSARRSGRRTRSSSRS